MQDTYDLRDRIDDLEVTTGDGTELVTVSVPPDKRLETIRQRLRQEHASAENIKSDDTREDVQTALQRLRRVLGRYDETPGNGLVVYAGVVDGELQSHTFDDLPVPVGESRYVCDDTFDVSPLRAAVEPSDTYGLIVVERGGAAIGRLVGERVVPIRTMDSQVMGKSRAGGQSAPRFERERIRQTHEFYQSVGDVANTALLGDGSVSGVVLGGTLGSVEDFEQGDYLDHRLRERVLGAYAVEYGNEQGLSQLVTKAEPALIDADQQAARDALDRFFAGLTDRGGVAYGGDEVQQAIDYGAVDVSLVSAQLPADRRKEVETAVSQQGGETVVIDTASERGQQFYDAFGGLGALLRFPVN